MMEKTKRRLMNIIAVVLLIVLAACGWERKIVFKKPAGRESVEIQQRFPINLWGLRILLHHDGTRTTIYESRGDTFLSFADVLWSADNEELAVFICGNPPLRMEYSLSKNRSLPFDRMRSGGAAHIQADYHPVRNTMS